ncbi:hypothetical protein Pan97_03460 [Bremerella volcania]|uniref:Uncharacterized protein n=1 Tax=Bremerella volcania TaxID=2527984 RepID=A0A518C2B1_9BACT|nr:hypothetical protein [Bremerella volcania]QDU73376.1 hypothetical protein Pan97_03460 [Bremerella volcania]
MTTNHDQPEPSGATKPQVVVRAGKYFVCSSCGTMVEVPADVVGQLVIAVDPSPQEELSPPESANLKPPQQQTLIQESPSRPARSKRLQQPDRSDLTGTMIDGLGVPSSQELDRALAWVSFHLKVLDRQGSELKRLQKLLKQQPMPCPRPRGHAPAAATQSHVVRECHSERRHAHEKVSMAPEERSQSSNKTQQRGPP